MYVRRTAPHGVVKHGREHLFRLSRRLLVERGQSGTGILCSTGILPVSRRGIPVRGPKDLPLQNFDDTTGGTPVGLMAKMAMLRSCASILGSMSESFLRL